MRVSSLAAIAIILVQPQTRSLPATSGSIDGVVVRLGSSEGIPTADVELTRIEGTREYPLGSPAFPQGSFSPGAIVQPTAAGDPDISRTRTKEDGHFHFDDLKPGVYTLRAARAGGSYSPTEFGQRDPRGHGIHLPMAAGEIRKDIALEMAPSGSISGRVYDADGHAAGRVRVMALEPSYEYGQTTMRIVQAMVSDDHGDYRLFWLPPGQYILAARPEDIRRQTISLLIASPASVEPMVETIPQALVTHRALSNGDVVEETYEVVYRNEAVELAPGANVGGMDISLLGSRVPARRIRGIVFDVSGKPWAGASVRAIPRVIGPSVVTPSATTRSDGTFEIVGVGRAAYYLRALAGNSGPTSIVEIEAGDHDVNGVKLLANRGFDITGSIVVDGGSISDKDMSELRPGLVSSNWLLPGVQQTNRIRDDGFTFVSVPPGDYRLSLRPLLQIPTGPFIAAPVVLPGQGNLYLKAIQMGSIDILNNGLHLSGPPDSEIRVILGANGGVLEGRVIDARGSPVINATVLISPTNTIHLRGDLYKSVSTDAEGRLRIQGIAPGDYKAFAWRTIRQGRWFDPAFMRNYESHGMLIHIVEGNNARIDLTIIPD